MKDFLSTLVYCICRTKTAETCNASIFNAGFSKWHACACRKKPTLSMWRLQEIICVVRQSQILHSQHLEAKWRRGCRHCSDHVVHRGWCVAVLTHIFKVNQLQGNPSADCAQFSRTVCESRRVVTQVLPQPNFYYKHWFQQPYCCIMH